MCTRQLRYIQGLHGQDRGAAWKYWFCAITSTNQISLFIWTRFFLTAVIPHQTSCSYDALHCPRGRAEQLLCCTKLFKGLLQRQRFLDKIQFPSASMACESKMQATHTPQCRIHQNHTSAANIRVDQHYQYIPIQWLTLHIVILNLIISEDNISAWPMIFVSKNFSGKSLLKEIALTETRCSQGNAPCNSDVTKARQSVR